MNDTGTSDSPLILYTDAGTHNNGKRGYQKTIIVVTDEIGTVLVEKWIGDYTNNEGEILAIVNALAEIDPNQPKEIYSDSQIAVNWTLRGWPEKLRNKHRKTVGEKLNNRLALYIEEAQLLLKSSNSTIQWIPREENIAGQYIEKTYEI